MLNVKNDLIAKVSKNEVEKNFNKNLKYFFPILKIPAM